MKIITYKVPVTWNQDSLKEEEEKKVEEHSEDVGNLTGGDVVRIATELSAFNSAQIRETRAIKGQYVLRKKLVS